jgi:hypothetical protein
MYRFIALIILMGHDVWHTVKDFWSASELHCTPFYSKVMKYDPFMHVMKVLLFENNQYPPEIAAGDMTRWRCFVDALCPTWDNRN